MLYFIYPTHKLPRYQSILIKYSINFTYKIEAANNYTYNQQVSAYIKSAK